MSIEAEAGPIGILVNNAGWDKAMGFLDTDPALWKKVIGINYFGPIHMHHAVLPGMVERGGGKVVNIASDAGRVGSSGEAVYAGCKAGVIALTKTLARELARSNITLNVVCPGPTETPGLLDADTQTEDELQRDLAAHMPLGRRMQPEELVGAAVYLASPSASATTGHLLVVDGGWTAI